MRTNKLLLVDGNNLLYRAYFSHSGLSSFGGQKLNAIFGFLNILAAAIRRFKLDECIVCWDGKRDANRMKLHPEYKGDRKQKITMDPEDLHQQKDIIKKLLHLLGVKQIVNKDKEADDLIYIVQRRKRKEKPVIILSSDKDFDQLVRSNVFIWNDKIGQMITVENMPRVKGYKPSQCVDYLSLLGDKSDNIPGYRGMGPVKVKQFMDKYGSIAKYLLDGEPFSGVNALVMSELQFRNAALIDLKWHYNMYHRQLKLVYYKTKTPILQEKEYIKLAASLGLRQFREEKFINIFKKLGA